MTRDGQRSTGQLMREVASDTATLVRKEVELAKQEALESIGAKARGAAALMAAAVIALVGFVFLGSTMAWWLSEYLEPWLARLITAGALFLLAGLAVGVGMGQMKKKSRGVEETKRTVKEDLEWARAQLKR